MTEEDEEFNRIEMESRIKQNYVRDIKKPSREALLAEVAVLTEMVRVLSARVAELESQEPAATIAVRWHEPVGKVAYVLEVNLPVGVHKLYTHPPQRTEQNFCTRCGKRTNDIHTCTPPQRKEQEPVGFAGVEVKPDTAEVMGTVNDTGI